MSFDDDADIPMNDLMKQWGVPHQQVISLIGGVKRMTPDGNLAVQFDRRGYPVETHPSWFGTRQQLDASLVEVDATLVEPVELGALVDETVDDTVYTPKNAVPKDQDSQVTHSAAQRTTTATQRGATKSPPPPPGSTNTITAAQQNLLQQNGVTYEAANGIWVKTVPQARVYFTFHEVRAPKLIRTCALFLNESFVYLVICIRRVSHDT